MFYKNKAVIFFAILLCNASTYAAMRKSTEDRLAVTRKSTEERIAMRNSVETRDTGTPRPRGGRVHPCTHSFCLYNTTRKDELVKHLALHEAQKNGAQILRCLTPHCYFLARNLQGMSTHNVSIHTKNPEKEKKQEVPIQSAAKKKCPYCKQKGVNLDAHIWAYHNFNRTPWYKRFDDVRSERWHRNIPKPASSGSVSISGGDSYSDESSYDSGSFQEESFSDLSDDELQATTATVCSNI